MSLVITTTPPFESDMFMRGEAPKKKTGKMTEFIKLKGRKNIVIESSVVV